MKQNDAKCTMQSNVKFYTFSGKNLLTIKALKSVAKVTKTRSPAVDKIADRTGHQ